MPRTTPYGSFNYLVNLNDRGEEEPLGGFSDVSGIGTEITIAEYRNGNAAENHVEMIPGISKTMQLTLKRGVVNSTDLWRWIDDTRRTGPSARREVVITLLDEARAAVQKWTLQNVVPTKYTGPTLAAKGGGDVAMEELVLSVENINFDQVG